MHMIYKLSVSETTIYTLKEKTNEQNILKKISKPKEPHKLFYVKILISGVL